MGFVLLETTEAKRLREMFMESRGSENVSRSLQSAIKSIKSHNPRRFASAKISKQNRCVN